MSEIDSTGIDMKRRSRSLDYNYNAKNERMRSKTKEIRKDDFCLEFWSTNYFLN